MKKIAIIIGLLLMNSSIKSTNKNQSKEKVVSIKLKQIDQTIDSLERILNVK